MYYSTRNNDIHITASEALLRGISEDGGLFLPDEIPHFELKKLLPLSYQDLAVTILRGYLDDFTKEEVQDCVARAYNKENFEEEMVGLKTFDGYSFLELFKGPTLAFKDMALTLLPFLMETAMKKRGVGKIKILTATSGDTGSAALSGFSHVDNIEIEVLYPHHGISQIQEKQMLYFTGASSRAYALKNGNFDACQKEAKKCLVMKDDRVKLSSANSINIGRLVPQIVYYFYAYLTLVNHGTLKLGDPLDVIVPTGNFGNIFACYLAKKMGLPIGKMISSSNKNDVLDEFFRTGVYDSRRTFYVTNSPSMDILVSSNLERLLSLVSSEKEVTSYMKELKENGHFEVSASVKKKLKDFGSFSSSEEETLDAMRKSFEENDYLIDPHTAVAYDAYLKYQRETGNHVLIVSTASYYKFPLTVQKALGLAPEDEIASLSTIRDITHEELPGALKKVLASSTPKVVITEKEFEKTLFSHPAIEIKSPASSANLGPGFDIAGIAYEYYNVYRFERSAQDELEGFEKRYEENNLVLKAYRHVFESHGMKEIPVKIIQKEQNIPTSRGLGSSSACIVAGVLAANEMLNNKFSVKECLAMMSELEGHPDNVAAAYLGNFTASYYDGKEYHFFREKVSRDLKFILCIPDFELSTSLARSVLPKEIPLPDATYNGGRLIALPGALKDGNIDELVTIMSDRIHEPYRYPLIPGADVLRKYAGEKHLPLVISGAGSTLLLISKDTSVMDELNQLKTDVRYTYVLLNVSKDGAIVRKEY